MADQIILLNMGKVMQIGSPMELYHNPAKHLCRYVYGNTRYECFKSKRSSEISSAEIQREEFFGYRPEKAMLDTKPMEAMFSLKSKVLTKEMLGSEILYKVENEFGAAEY